MHVGLDMQSPRQVPRAADQCDASVGSPSTRGRRSSRGRLTEYLGYQKHDVGVRQGRLAQLWSHLSLLSAHMAKTGLKPTTCGLCRTAADLQESHVVPEFTYAPIYDEKHEIIAFEPF